MLRTLFWYLFGACAFGFRMFVIAAGCTSLAAFVMDWINLDDWRFRVVGGLFVAAYLLATLVELIAEKITKSIKAVPRKSTTEWYSTYKPDNVNQPPSYPRPPPPPSPPSKKRDQP